MSLRLPTGYKAAMSRYPLVAFMAITFGIAWGAWFASGSKASSLIGAYAPGIAAIVLAVFIGGVAGLQRLFERFLIWRVHIICYVAALLLPAILSLSTTAVHMMFGGDAPNFAAPPIRGVKLPEELQGWSVVALIFPLFIQHIFYGTAIAEELGWRGVVLPRLQERHSPLRASLVLGVLWAVWILPLYWNYGWVAGNERAFLVLGLIPSAILSTWIYNISGGSLLLCVMFNVSLKVTDLVLALPAAHPLVAVCVYCMAAGVVISLAGPQLGRAPAAVTALPPSNLSFLAARKLP